MNTDKDPAAKDWQSQPKGPGYATSDVKKSFEANVGQNGGGSGAYVNAADAAAMSGPPVDGTLLYPEAAEEPRLSRFVLQGYKDIWAAVLFLLMFLMTVVWGIVNLIIYEPLKVDDDGEQTDFQEAGISGFMVGASIVASLVLSVVGAIIGLLVIRMFPKQAIYIANGFVVLMFIASAVMSFIWGSVIAGIILIILALLQALWLFLVRNRIPLSAELLKTASVVVWSYKALVVTNLIFCLFTAGYMVLWFACMFPPADRISADRAKGADGFLIALFVLIFFWTAQVIPNIMHVTTAGVAATWYFAGRDNMPSHPTLSSLKRALTTSFGSICFGSLLVALIQFLRYLVESSRQDNDNFLKCIMDCLLKLLERLVQFFNTFAFVHVAIYGCGYIEAAKRTFALCKQCFFAAYFNECLVGPTLSFLTLAVSALIGVIVGLATIWVLGLLAFFISLIVQSLFYTPVSSVVTTIFVCFAEVPDALQHSNPELYAAIHAADAGGTYNNAAPPQNQV